MDKLIRQLRRELTKNPKKSALLGCGLLAAIYFWAPLITGWVSKPESGRSKAPPGDVQPTAANTATESTAEAVERLLPGDWRELAWRIEQEPLRSLTGLAAPVRDPFARGAATMQADMLTGTLGAVGTAPAIGSIAASAGAATWGLKLEAIVIRGKSRAAIINGAVYREQEQLAATGPVASGAPPRVLKIHADHVEIGWGEETLRLELERGELAPGDRIVPISVMHEDA